MSASALILEPGYGADANRRDISPGLDALASLKTVYSLPPLEECSDRTPYGLTEPDRATAENDPDSVVYLPFTSGTTGEPKGVLHTDNTLLANARTIAADWHFDDESCVYTMSPLSHNLGFGALIALLPSAVNWWCMTYQRAPVFSHVSVRPARPSCSVCRHMR